MYALLLIAPTLAAPAPIIQAQNRRQMPWPFVPPEPDRPDPTFKLTAAKPYTPPEKSVIAKPAVTDKPASDKPATDKPTADKPTADKTTADKPTADKPASNSRDLNCFSRVSTYACRSECGNLTSASKALAACFAQRADVCARLVALTELAPGDIVLSADETKMPIFETVLANEWAHDNLAVVFLTLKFRGGMLSVTPDHLIFIDGAKAAAHTARLGSKLRSTNGSDVNVTAITTSTGLRINPHVASGRLWVVDAHPGHSISAEGVLEGVLATTHVEVKASI